MIKLFKTAAAFFITAFVVMLQFFAFGVFVFVAAMFLLVLFIQCLQP